MDAATNTTTTVAGSDDETPPVTRNWSIVTLVLAGLYLAMSIFGLTQIGKGPMAEMADASYFRGLTIAQIAIAAAFVIGSIGALRNQAWGRLTVAYAAAGAISTIILGFFVQFGLRDNPAYVQALADQITKSSPQAAAMPEDALTKAAQTNAMVMFVVTAIMSVIQFVYCLLLYWHMSAPPEEFRTVPSAARVAPGRQPP